MASWGGYRFIVLTCMFLVAVCVQGADPSPEGWSGQGNDFSIANATAEELRAMLVASWEKQSVLAERNALLEERNDNLTATIRSFMEDHGTAIYLSCDEEVERAIRGEMAEQGMYLLISLVLFFVSGILLAYVLVGRYQRDKRRRVKEQNR